MSTVNGIKAIEEAVKKHQGTTAKGLRIGLYRAGLFLQRESQKIVPIDDDVLRPSAHTRMEGQGFASEAIVSYSTEYAVFVHENLEARHKPGKSAKYLEKPAREHRGRMAQIVIKAIKDTK